MPKLSADPGSFLPLTPVVYEILLALVDEARHGYAVMREVDERSEGRMQLRPGTLYRAMDRLLDQGLIEETDTRPEAERDDERRRYYGLTSLGRRVLTAEAERLERAVASARRKRVLGHA